MAFRLISAIDIHLSTKQKKNGESMKSNLWAWCGALVVAGCASYPAPTEHLASAMAELRVAQEVSTSGTPQAQLQLKLAQDELAQAKALINDGNTERADYMTLRAYNDAALALALSRENAARARAEQAAAQATPAPQAQLQLKLAQDELAQAKALINDGKTERADYMTLRAYNDAALALALSRENAARARAEQAAAQATPAPQATPTPSSAP
jgi:flagellin-specific chaperone FliS